MDITCKYDSINIQHAHCDLVVPNVRCLQRVFLLAKLKAAYV